MKRYVFEVENIGEISDGSHSFNELYDHRCKLFAVICNQNKEFAWKSWLHNDGTMFEDYFIVGISIPYVGDFSYHYHKDYWELFECKDIKKAPEWDGHTSDDITRLFNLWKKPNDKILIITTKENTEAIFIKLVENNEDIQGKIKSSGKYIIHKKDGSRIEILGLGSAINGLRGYKFTKVYLDKNIELNNEQMIILRSICIKDAFGSVSYIDM